MPNEYSQAVEEIRMQIICISRDELSGGDKLAERLAIKLGCACVSREHLNEAAIKEGIQVGKLEMAMVRPGIFSERLATEREHYLAFSTTYLCDRATESRLVYHGHTGHLLLPGIDHVVRVRVVSDEEQRIRTAIEKRGLDPKRARRYIRDVDEDWARWARSMYGVGWQDAAQYDLIINLQHMSIENAASALTAVAQLPDFQMTPASEKAMRDLWLSARCRVALACNERTARATFKLRAEDGVVTVTFLPKDAQLARFIPDVLTSLEGVETIHTTMATTNIVWIQEKFNSSSEVFQQIVELATKWNAAVELLRLVPGGTDASINADQQPNGTEPGEYDGGIEDDEEKAVHDDGGIRITLDELAAVGRSGGGKTVYGTTLDLISSFDRSVSHSLVVVGDVFLDTVHDARVRMKRELERFVGEHVAAPVIGAEELKGQYLFGKRDVAGLVGFLAFVAMIYCLIFTNQEAVLKFLLGQWWGEGIRAKIVVAASVFLFVPIIAHCYGNVAKSFMKLIKME